MAPLTRAKEGDGLIPVMRARMGIEESAFCMICLLLSKVAVDNVADVVSSLFVDAGSARLLTLPGSSAD